MSLSRLLATVPVVAKPVVSKRSLICDGEGDRLRDLFSTSDKTPSNEASQGYSGTSTSLRPSTVSLGSVNAQITTHTGLSASIASGGLTKDNTLGLAGTVLAGVKVSVFDDQKFLGYAKVVGTTWSFDTPALSDGMHRLKVVMSTGSKSQAFGIHAVIDTVAKGTFSSTLLTDTGASPSIRSGESTTDHTLGLSGTAEAGSVVKIYDGTTHLGQTTADARGRWSFTTPELTDGTHQFSAGITDLAGNSKTVAGVSATLTTPPPPPPPEPAGTWSATAGWGSVDALAAINAKTGKNLADIKASTATPWGIDKANINDVWNYGYTGKGITIAQVDTGIDLNNADVTHNLHPASWNFVDNTANVMDDHGHGTFVASEMVAAHNGIGLTGASYDASLMVLKVFGADGSGSAETICTAICYAVDHGANIINLSLGGGDNAGYAPALQYALDHNVLVVMAAGNSNGTTPVSPALYAQQFNNCLAVGGLQLDSQMGVMSLASFSNQAGSTTAYGFVGAAGLDVTGYTLGGIASTWAGTSLAAPLVSAAAALLWSADVSASATQISHLISQTSHAVLQ